jgi:hypothetical protein
VVGMPAPRSHRPSAAPRLAAIACFLVVTACSSGQPAAPATAAPVPSSAPTSAPTTGAATTPPRATPVAGPPSSPPAGSGQSGTPRCTTGELKGSLVGGEGAAGTVHRTLELTNSGSRTCELTGFPGVSYVAGDDGHQVGPAAAMSGTRGAPVRLAVGDAARADVGFVQVLNFDPAVCMPTPVRGLRVYPPGDTASLFVAAEGTGCAGTPPGNQLTVTTLGAR